MSDIMKTSDCTKKSDTFHSSIDVLISDWVLTPFSCAFLVNEIMKNVLYHKAQIPYPYGWLKTIVNKKRNKVIDSTETPEKITNFTINRHYQVVSNTFDAIEKNMASIEEELSNSKHIVKEIVIVFGVNPACPKEVITVKLPVLPLGHIHKNHAMENSKKQQKTLRNLFLSEVWMNSDKPIACSNMYIFLKKEISDREVTPTDTFTSSKPFTSFSKVKHLLINLNYSNEQVYTCCANLKVFNNMCDNETPNKKSEDVSVTSDNSEIWAQSRILVQGFKDCFINKVPACELW